MTDIPASSAAVNADERCQGCGVIGDNGACIMADVDVMHLRRPDGSCVISYNGQGHLPCSEHASPIPAPSSAKVDEPCESCGPMPDEMYGYPCRECGPKATMPSISAERARALKAAHHAKVDDQTTAAGEDALAEFLHERFESGGVDCFHLKVYRRCGVFARALLASKLVVSREQHDREVRAASEKAWDEAISWAASKLETLVGGIEMAGEFRQFDDVLGRFNPYREAKP